MDDYESMDGRKKNPIYNFENPKWKDDRFFGKWDFKVSEAFRYSTAKFNFLKSTGREGLRYPKRRRCLMIIHIIIRSKLTIETLEQGLKYVQS